MLTPCSSEADGDQTERVISERVPASEGGARARGKSDDDRTTMPRLHPLQPSRSKFRIQRMLFIIANARRVSEGMDAVGPCVAVARARGPQQDR